MSSTPPISAIEEIQLLEEEALNGTIVEERISNDQDALKLFGVSRTAVRKPDMTKLEEKAASHNKSKWQKQYRIPSRPGQEKAEQEKAEKIAKERAEKMAEALIDSLRKKDGCSSSQLPNINQLGQRILMATEKKQSRKTEVKRLQSFNISEGGIRICESALLKALKSQKQSIAESLIEKARSPSERREKKRQALVEQIPRDDPTTMKKEKSALKKQERERQCIAMNKMKDKIGQLRKQLEQRDPQKSMHYHRDRSRSPIRRSNDRKDHHRFKSDPNRNESPRKRSREADRSRSKRRSEGDKKSTQTAITEGPPTEPKEGKMEIVIRPEKITIVDQPKNLTRDDEENFYTLKNQIEQRHQHISALHFATPCACLLQQGHTNCRVLSVAYFIPPNHPWKNNEIKSWSLPTLAHMMTAEWGIRHHASVRPEELLSVLQKNAQQVVDWLKSRLQSSGKRPVWTKQQAETIMRVWTSVCEAGRVGVFSKTFSTLSLRRTEITE